MNCPERDDCPLSYTTQGCRTVNFHFLRVEDGYHTPIERAYRELPENCAEMCLNDAFDMLDNDLTLTKPSLPEMIIALTVKFEE